MTSTSQTLQDRHLQWPLQVRLHKIDSTIDFYKSDSTRQTPPMNSTSPTLQDRLLQWPLQVQLYKTDSTIDLYKSNSTRQTPPMTSTSPNLQDRLLQWPLQVWLYKTDSTNDLYMTYSTNDIYKSDSTRQAPPMNSSWQTLQIITTSGHRFQHIEHIPKSSTIIRWFVNKKHLKQILQVLNSDDVFPGYLLYEFSQNDCFACSFYSSIWFGMSKCQV